jgi:protein-disulfide isomerase/uncharacterized membrane protein/peroxiredoxin
METTPMRTGAGWFGAVAGLLAGGIGVAGYLTRLHLELFYGSEASAICDLGGSFNCSTVNASAHAEVLGVPHALIALPAYVVMAGLAGLAWRRKSRPALAALFGAATLTVLYSGYLAYVSSVVIGAWCLFCLVLYGVNLGVAVLAGWAGGAAIVGDAVRAPFRAPLVVGGAGVAFGLLLAGSYGAYDQVRGHMAAEAAAAAVAAPPRVAKAGPTGPSTTGTAATAASAGGPETKKVRLGEKRADVPVPKGAPTLGPASAKVTLVEFSDFQCPFCKRLAGSLRQLAEEYPKDVRIAYVEFPLNTDCNRVELKKSMHPEACHAAAAAVCAQAQGKFWEMHDALFDDQASLGNKRYLAVAKDLGLDMGAYAACLDAPATMETIGAQTEAGGPLGVNGTPTFFVNGRQMSGAQPIEVLRAVVDAEIAGIQGALDLDVKVGTEITGPVGNRPETVAVSTLGPSYRIDAFEASLDGKKAVSRAGVEPARNVSWYAAKAACEAAGKRLCTEEEWLAACTGDKPVDTDGNGLFADDTVTGRRYGYGPDRRAGLCADSRNPDAVGELLTGNHPRCGTPDGIYDQVGNVKEWVGLSPDTAAVKGGSYSSGESARCGYHRDDIAPETEDPATGFRCCAGPADVPAPRPGRDVGEKLASFEVPKVDGGTFSTKTIAGKPTIVTFWASWCGPCKKELPVLATLYQKYEDQGLNIVAISVDTEEAKLKQYLSTASLPFTIGRDPGGVLLDTFSKRGVPASFWIKRDGTIRLRTIGLPPNGEKRLEELVVELLGP